MSKLMRTIALIGLVAIVVASFYRWQVFREPPPRPVKFAFVTGGSGPYWQATVRGARDAARDLNAELQVEMPAEDENLAAQMDLLARITAAEVDGIAISPIDAEGQTHKINELVRETKVVTFDSDAPLSDRQSHVGTSNFAAGRTCARIVNEALPDGGKIAVLLANLTKENLIDRRAAFQERMNQYADDVEAGAEPKFTVVGYFEDNGNDDKCAQNIRDVIAAHPDLACIAGMNSRHGPILLRVLEEEGKLGQFTLVTFDAPDETLDGIEAGHIYATIAQDPYIYGYEAVKILTTLCRGDGVALPVVGKGSVYVGAEAIRKDNLGTFRERMRTRQERTGSAERSAA